MPFDSFVEHVLDLLGPLGPVRARAMMGGHSISFGALPVALVAGDRLYLKVDEITRPSFEAAGGEAFTYEARGRLVRMSYWSPPDGALDGPDAMLPWARLALEAATRARRDAGRRRRRPSGGAGARRARGRGRRGRVADARVHSPRTVAGGGPGAPATRRGARPRIVPLRDSRSVLS